MPQPTSPATSIRIEYMPLSELLGWPGNPKAHDLEDLIASFRTLGFNDPCAIDETSGRLVEGHGRDEALSLMQSRGESAPLHIEVRDGEWFVPVVRGLHFANEGLARAYLTRHNRSTERGGWNDEALKTWLQDLAAADLLLDTGFEQGDLEELLASLQGDAPPLEEEEEPASGSELEAAQEKWTVQPGDIWEIASLSASGQCHRVLCGDGLAPGALDKLLQGSQPDVIHCDPPYGISIVNTGGQIGSGQIYRPVIGDDSTDTAVQAYQLTVKRFPKAVHVWWGGNYYADHLPPSMGWLVWDKQNDGLSFADVELAWTNQHRAARMFRHMWSGGARASETDERRIHPTQKPIALGVWVLEQLATPGGTVLDLFLGSGMTLLAAEQHGSICYASEIEPLYVAGVLERATRRGMSCTRAEP